MNLIDNSYSVSFPPITALKSNSRFICVSCFPS